MEVIRIKSLQEIIDSITNRIKSYTGCSIYKMSVINSFILAVSNIIKEVYDYIEDNKTPYLFTKLHDNTLDEWGYGVSLPRKAEESDGNYLYRLKNWHLINEKSNNVAINAALLNTEYAESIRHIPFTKGCGTSTVYVLPKKYDDENIKKSLEEAHDLIADVISPSIYVEFVVPKIREVSIYVNYKFDSSADEDQIKSNIYDNIKKYINELVPGDYIYVGYLNKIGMTETLVNYFSVSNFVIDNEEINSISVQQNIDTKLLLKDIEWIEVEL